jgi:hypothetical protein
MWFRGKTRKVVAVSTLSDLSVTRRFYRFICVERCIQMRIAGIISFAVLTVLLARVKCDEEDITVTAENLTQGVRHACAHDWIVRHSHAKHVTAHQQYEDTGPGKSRR